MTFADFKIQRSSLVAKMVDAETEAFPGSKAQQAYGRALVALATFDREHPEVLAAAETDRSAEVLGGKDIGGL